MSVDDLLQQIDAAGLTVQSLYECGARASDARWQAVVRLSDGGPEWGYAVGRTAAEALASAFERCVKAGAPPSYDWLA